MTTDKLEFKSFRSPSDKGWETAWKLYESSFPLKERRSEADHWAAVADPLFTADGIWRGEEFIGIMFHWDAGDFCYGEHLAIIPELRGQDMGSKALSAFCREKKRIVLEIDPPVDEVSIRRLHFYKKLEFVENSYEYIHPSFCRPFDPHKLVLMSWPDPISERQTHEMKRFVKERVLLYSDHRPILK